MDRKSPLAWPENEPRTPSHKRQSVSPFSVTPGRTFNQLDEELTRFKAKNVVLSIDTPFRNKLNDTAAALFFDLPGDRKISICCDLYMKQEDNIRALLKIIEAMRMIERYGGQNLSQKSFSGFAALPPPKDVWKILGISKGVGEALSAKMKREFVIEAFRERAKEGHSDNGGVGIDMAELTEARDEALKQLGVT